MQIPFHEADESSRGTTNRFTRTTRSTKLLAVVTIALLFQSSGVVHGQTTPDSYKVRLYWNASSSPDVTSYRVDHGSANRAYTGFITVGNVTTAEVTGLASGEPRYFAVTAINSIGMESAFSGEVSFLPGTHELWISTGASGYPPGENGGPVLLVNGRIGLQYDMEASQDLINWSVISTATITTQNGGWLQFSDPDAANFPQRFYRTREKP